MQKTSALVNIGSVLEEKLAAVGISSAEELIKKGSREAFVLLKMKDPGACISTLYALEGAVHGIRHGHLPQNKKEELKAFYRETCK